METITQYRSIDGVVFDTKSMCEAHEHNYFAAKEIMKPLGKQPTHSEFLNGAGYVQHDKEIVDAVAEKFLVFVKCYTQGLHTGDGSAPAFALRHGIIGRYLDDCAPAFINKHWLHFMCIDDQYREWGQPFYALNTDKGGNNTYIVGEVC